jgi:hypothetical protein
MFLSGTLPLIEVYFEYVNFRLDFLYLLWVHLKADLAVDIWGV